MSFADLLQDKLGQHEPAEIEELILDELFKVEDSLSEEQKEALEKYSSLIHLSMNGIGFKNLKNFPELPKLQILELSKNHLDGTDFGGLSKLYPSLYKLKVGENEIKTIDVFKGLESLSDLKKLDVSKNPFVNNNGSYKESIFDMLKNLEVIDKTNKEGEEIESTVYDDLEEGEDEMAEEFEEDEDDDPEEFEDEEDEDDEDDGSDEDDGKPSKKPKKH